MPDNHKTPAETLATPAGRQFVTSEVDRLRSLNSPQADALATLIEAMPREAEPRTIHIPITLKIEALMG